MQENRTLPYGPETSSVQLSSFKQTAEVLWDTKELVQEEEEGVQ
jgi:hypothetical protein